ncbi:hypothetical protein RCH10_003733 [Variovorax sp. GrIS 2.14]
MWKLSTPSRFRDCTIALLIAFAAFLVFNANGRLISAGDTYAARFLPFSLLRNHTALLDPIERSVAMGRVPPAAIGEDGSAYWILRGRHGQLISKYPLVVPLVVTPLYIPAAVYLESIEWDPHIYDKVARVMEKLCAALITAASVGLLFLLLRRRASLRLSLFLSVVYAFGTTTWVISSQALWSHGCGELLITATMLLITGRCTVGRVAAAGFLCALIAANRPPDGVLAVALGLSGLLWAGRRWVWFIAFGAIPVVLILAYNLGVVGHIAGAYALRIHDSDFNDDIAAGLAGLLFSPTRGLFVFSPFLLFVPCFILCAIRDRSNRTLTVALCTAIVVQLLVYAHVDWRQGVSWGPRWLTDIVPLLIWMLPPILQKLSRPGLTVFGVACAVSIAVQAVGAFWYTGAVDSALLTTKGKDRMRPMWDFRNAAFVAELRHPPAAADLLRDLQGNIDLVELVEQVVQDDSDGAQIVRQLDVAGWALFDLRSPKDVAVLLDGQEVAGTSQFFERPDVVKTLGQKNHAGWRLRIPAEQLTPGFHRLSVLARADSGGEVRVLRDRSFVVPFQQLLDPHERLLKYAAGQAIERIKHSQQPGGYWLTTFTRSAHFEKPTLELNTYLNAVMLDVLKPFTDDLRLQESLQKTRKFLSTQIEPDGLVRYHGRPEATTIGVLGCAITPDSDDTALAWRMAPLENREDLQKALRVMRSFRTPDGLYRTWLAQRRDYQCLDPGKESNPADIGIQMHIHMLLAQQDAAGAKQLCEALMRRVNDDSVWVYYSGAPLIIILRLSELHREGCPLVFAQERLKPPEPEQEIWSRMALLLTEIESGASKPESRAEAQQLLRDVASNGFSKAFTNPPLLYHNDMTGTVRRFYWSEVLGYALWLRLYRALSATKDSTATVSAALPDAHR